jgi:hypothetical protein
VPSIVGAAGVWCASVMAELMHRDKVKSDDHPSRADTAALRSSATAGIDFTYEPFRARAGPLQRACRL